jgi:hypothetical protein
MIFVVDAIGRLRCGRSAQRTRPVRASTRIAARALSGGVKRCGASGRGPTTSVGGILAAAGRGGAGGGLLLGVPVAFGDELE